VTVAGIATATRHPAPGAVPQARSWDTPWASRTRATPASGASAGGVSVPAIVSPRLRAMTTPLRSYTVASRGESGSAGLMIRCSVRASRVATSTYATRPSRVTGTVTATIGVPPADP